MKGARKKPAPANPRWQYLVEYGKGGALPFGQLDKLGADGWELCATISTPDTPSDMTSGWPAVVQFYFKRRIPA